MVLGLGAGGEAAGAEAPEPGVGVLEELDVDVPEGWVPLAGERLGSRESHPRPAQHALEQPGAVGAASGQQERGGIEGQRRVVEVRLEGLHGPGARSVHGPERRAADPGGALAEGQPPRTDGRGRAT